MLNIDKLIASLENSCPEVVFALLHGSARDGFIKRGSDIDLAFYLKKRATLSFYERVMSAVSEIAPGIECDIGILNNAEPVYRFEALRGKLLFARDYEAYLKFYSLTCREYESQLADYERQHRYRLAARE